MGIFSIKLFIRPFSIKFRLNSPSLISGRFCRAIPPAMYIALFMSLKYRVLSLRQEAGGRGQEGNIKTVLQKSENRSIS
jgi:hypothetical protein